MSELLADDVYQLCTVCTAQCVSTASVTRVIIVIKVESLRLRRIWFGQTCCRRAGKLQSTSSPGLCSQSSPSPLAEGSNLEPVSSLF